MNRANAVLIAEDLVSEVAPYCERPPEIVGSIRRCKEWVNDIDLVLLPQFMQLDALKAHLSELAKAQHTTLVGGDKYLKLLSYKGIQVDIYIADRETWATLLLIRTGSKEHNITLARRARELGYQLKADGHGLTWISKDVTVPIWTEEQLFHELGLAYREPWEREA